MFLPSAFGQDWNRATFRGDEIDGRPFELSDSYFLDLLSFSPSSGTSEVWARSDNGIRWSGGSIRTDEFTFDHELRIRQPIPAAPGLYLRFGYLESEDFDSRYRRVRAGFEQEVLGRGTRVSVLFEGTQLKQDNDFIFGAVHEAGPWRAEASFTAVDINEDKGKDGRKFPRDPYATHLAVDWTPATAWTFGLTWDAQLPMTILEPVEDRRFSLRKMQPRMRAAWRLGRADRLQLVARAEFSRSRRLTLSTGEELDREREFYWPSFEWRHFEASGIETVVGLRWLRLHEGDRRFQNRPLERRFERREVQLSGGLQIPVGEPWWFSPTLWLDWVELRAETPLNPSGTEHERGLEAKLGTALEWRGSSSIRIVVNPTFDLGSVEFGGGNLQVVLSF